MEICGLLSRSGGTSPKASGGSDDTVAERAPRKFDRAHEQIAAEIERASEPDTASPHDDGPIHGLM
jgi:hypothetical protein